MELGFGQTDSHVLQTSKQGVQRKISLGSSYINKIIKTKELLTMYTCNNEEENSDRAYQLVLFHFLRIFL